MYKKSARKFSSEMKKESKRESINISIPIPIPIPSLFRFRFQFYSAFFSFRFQFRFRFLTYFDSISIPIPIPIPIPHPWLPYVGDNLLASATYRNKCPEPCTSRYYIPDIISKSGNSKLEAVSLLTLVVRGYISIVFCCAITQKLDSR